MTNKPHDFKSIVSVALKVLTALILLLTGFNCNRPDLRTFPKRLDDYQRTRIITGEEAGRIINRLHENPVAATRNEIAVYENDRGQAMIYVSYYKDADEAEQEWQRMIDKISIQNSVFIEGTVFLSGQTSVYRCFGLGQTHYVFTKGDRLFWLSVETIGAARILSDYLANLGD